MLVAVVLHCVLGIDGPYEYVSVCSLRLFEEGYSIGRLEKSPE